MESRHPKQTLAQAADHAAATAAVGAAAQKAELGIADAAFARTAEKARMVRGGSSYRAQQRVVELCSFVAGFWPRVSGVQTP